MISEVHKVDRSSNDKLINMINHCSEYMSDLKYMGCGQCKYRRFCEEFIKNGKYLKDISMELIK